MSILSGYKRFKKYLRTAEGYKLCSEWTNADSVEMTDGRTLQETADSITSDVESTQNDITDMHNELKTSLGGMTFGVDAAGRYGYIKAGADTVTPFKKNDWETLSTENIKEYVWSDKATYSGNRPGYSFRSPSAGEIATMLGVTDPIIAASAKIMGIKDVTLPGRPGWGGMDTITIDALTGSGGTVSVHFQSDGDLTNTPVAAHLRMTILVYIPS